MTWVDALLLIAIGAVIGFAVWFMVREKKKGKTCMGCPYHCQCDKDSCCDATQKNTMRQV